MKKSTAIATRNTRVATTPRATTLLQALTLAASNPNTDVEKMERLFKMHQEMLRAQAEATFNAALSQAQQKIVPVIKNKKNAHTNSSYADLAAVIEEITPIYTGEGLALSYDTEPLAGHDKWLRIVAILSHSAGHSRRYTLDLPYDDAGSQGKSNKTAVQAAVSSSSYGRRVLACMIFNVATVDEDGNRKKENGLAPDKMFLTKLELAASKGVLALKAAWEGGTAAQRKSCADVWKLGELKATATAADGVQ